MIKTVLKGLAYAAAAWLWWWAIVFKVPALLTAGALGSFLGIMLLALGVIVPAVLGWKFLKGKFKETPQ